MNRTGLFEKKSVRIMAGIMLAFFLLYLGARFYLKAFHGFAWDYSVNWVAALGLRESLSLYDRAALQQLAISHIDSGARVLFNGRFTSFIGLPSTAILHLPFTAMPYEISVLCYRITALCAMLATIWLTGLALPSALHFRAWLLGALCLLLWNSFAFSLQLGQVDAWVMLSLAAAIFAVSRAWWKRAGIAIAIAVLLKITPAWLLLYCVLKRQWSIVCTAAIGIAAGLLLSGWPQHGEDLWQFFTAVLPTLGDSPLHVQNQALGAFLARLATSDTQLLSFAAGLGVWKIVGVVPVLLLLLILYRATRDAVLTAADLAAVIPLALLAGPLTWDHYLSWAIIPVVLLATRLPLCGLLLLLFLLLPLAFPVPYMKADVIAANWCWRLLTGLQTVAVLALAMWAIKASKADRH
jgi:hypothetical protein